VKGGKSHSQSREGWHEGDTGKGSLLLKRLRLKCDGIEQEAREYSPRTVGKRLDIIRWCYFKTIISKLKIPVWARHCSDDCSYWFHGWKWLNLALHLTRWRDSIHSR
jgi:hypothetical protein